MQGGDVNAGTHMGTGLDGSGHEVQQEHTPADIAKSFDEQANMFAMEYMRNGDVRGLISLRCPASAMYNSH